MGFIGDPQSAEGRPDKIAKWAKNSQGTSCLIGKIRNSAPVLPLRAALMIMGGLTPEGLAMRGSKRMAGGFLAALAWATAPGAAAADFCSRVYPTVLEWCRESFDENGEIRKPGSSAAISVLPRVEMGGWKFDEFKDRITGKTTYKVAILANKTRHEAPRRGGVKTDDAYLLFGCDNKGWFFYLGINGQLIAGRSSRVTYRIDQRAPAENRRWANSTDYSAAGSWENATARAFAASLQGASSLAWRVVDDVFGMTEADFDLEGTAAALARLKEACK